jgi:hypothetical protein
MVVMLDLNAKFEWTITNMSPTRSKNGFYGIQFSFYFEVEGFYKKKT